MPRTNTTGKEVHSFRISREGVHQLQTLASVMGRSEADVVEIALDRMYREEIRYNRVMQDRPSDIQYRIKKSGERENESDRDTV